MDTLRVRLRVERLEARLPPAQYRVPLLNFGPYIGSGEDPILGTGQVTVQELEARARAVAPFTDGFRTFGCTGDLQPLSAIVRSLGKTAAIGADLNGDTVHDQAEIAALVSQAIQGNVDIAIVGNETFLGNAVSEATLLGYIDQVQTALDGRGIPVTTAQTYNKLLDHPAVLDAVDVVYAHIYPFHDRSPIDLAIGDLSRAYRRVRAATAPDKAIILGETGWPSGGSPRFESVPSPENAARYFFEATSWARANGVRYAYFEAYDEPWKVREEGDIGPHWGLFDINAVLKPGMQTVFDGATTASPFIDFFAMPATVRTNIPTFVVAGVAFPGYTVAVNGVPIPAGEIDALGAFAHTVALAAGDNPLTVTLTNPAGQVVRTGIKTAAFDAGYSTANMQLLYVDAVSPSLNGTLVIDVAGNAILGLLPGQHVRGIAPGGHEVYMDTRAVVSTATHATTRTLPFSQPIATNSFLVSPTGDKLYSRNEFVTVSTNAVQMWPTDITTGIGFDGTPVPGGPVITADGTAIFARNPVVRIDTASGAETPTGIVPPGAFLSDIELSADGMQLITASYAGGGTLSVYNAMSFQFVGSVEINDFSGEVRPLNNGRVAVGNSGNPNPTNPGGFVRTVNVAAPQIIGEVRNMLADNLATNASRDAVFATSGDRAGIDVFAVGTDGQLTLLKTFILGIGQYFVGSGVPQNDHVRAIVYKPGQTPPPVVVGVAVNGTAAQRSRVTSVSVTFSAQVAFADPANVAAAFQLARIGGGAVGGFTATVAIVDGATVVTLNGFSGAETQFGSLADGRYRLTVRVSQVIGLDGDGNGTGGDDFTLTGSVANGLYRLYGDTNGDATVNAADFGPFRAAFGSSAVQAGYLDYLDFNGDGIINAFDFAQFRLRFGSGVP